MQIYIFKDQSCVICRIKYTTLQKEVKRKGKWEASAMAELMIEGNMPSTQVFSMSLKKDIFTLASKYRALTAPCKLPREGEEPAQVNR